MVQSESKDSASQMAQCMHFPIYHSQHDMPLRLQACGCNVPCDSSSSFDLFRALRSLEETNKAGCKWQPAWTAWRRAEKLRAPGARARLPRSSCRGRGCARRNMPTVFMNPSRNHSSHAIHNLGPCT